MASRRPRFGPAARVGLPPQLVIMGCALGMAIAIAAMILLPVLTPWEPRGGTYAGFSGLMVAVAGVILAEWRGIAHDKVTPAVVDDLRCAATTADQRGLPRSSTLFQNQSR